MASFKTEISHLFGFEESNSRLNDLYKAALISNLQLKVNQQINQFNPKDRTFKEIKPQATVNNDNSKEPTEIRERNLSGQSLGSNSSGSERRKSSKNIRNTRNRKMIVYSIIGFVFLGIAIWSIITLIGEMIPHQITKLHH